MRLPRALGLPAAEAYMSVLFRRSHGQRDIVARNFSRVLGHPPGSEIVRTATAECFRLYGRYWYETFALRRMPSEEVERRLTIEGFEHIQGAARAGRGGIMVLPHMGNWDAAGHWVCLQGHRLTAVAEELEPPEVFELFLRHRRALGMNIVALSSSNVGRTIVGLLAENHIVSLVADRDLTGRGVDVEMFGATRRLPAGPAYLSLVTGAPLCICAVFTTEEGWHTKISAPVEFERTGAMRADVATLTGIVAAGFERYISESPADWHMFQPAWPEDEALATGPRIRDPG
jgi:phosphatidylinositol dimannoside acyltransferase